MKKLLFYIILFLIALWLSGFVVFAHRINHYKADNTAHTEAIIALTGGRNRIAEAVKLLNEGKADRMFISGVGPRSTFSDIKHRQKLTVSTDRDIALGRKATNTVENAIETTEWLDRHHIRSIRLVTSNYHVPRSVTEFKTRNPGIKIVVHPVYSENVEKKWWTSWHTFSLIFSEYNKFLYVYIRSHLQPLD